MEARGLDDVQSVLVLWLVESCVALLGAMAIRLLSGEVVMLLAKGTYNTTALQRRKPTCGKSFGQ